MTTKSIWLPGPRHYQAALEEVSFEAEHIADVVREVTNAYDANALVVMIGQTKIGYLPRQMAAELAPIMDAKSVTKLRARVRVYVPGVDRKLYAAQLVALDPVV